MRLESNRKWTILCLLTLLLFAGISDAKHLYLEKHYQEKWCKTHGGRIEVSLPDGTRCDCLTPTHAIEIEFAEKWAEAIGQALYYSIQTGKKPGIGLILESLNDRKCWIRLNTVIDHFGLKIDTWEIKQ